MVYLFGVLAKRPFFSEQLPAVIATARYEREGRTEHAVAVVHQPHHPALVGRPSVPEAAAGRHW